jgi:AmmeMemoRadiSam system protein B
MTNREAVVAGQFYPGQPKVLRKTVESFIQRPKSLLAAKAVVVPHAGYIYSGSTAGAVFSAVQLPERIIILGPNHTGRGAALSLAPAGVWQTPLGAVSIDEELNRRLLSECPGLQEDLSAHAHEHSLEVQLPFLQVLRPDFRFAAICVGTADYGSLEGLGHGMARIARSLKESILLVASSDMSHYQSADVAARQDKFAIDRFLAIDPPGLYRVVLEKDISMCGFAPAVAVLIAVRDLGASKGQLIRYTNSGEASGDFNRVVAYAGMAVE